MNTLVILGIIYVVSIIGTIISVRYDDSVDENSYIFMFIFCPLVNTGVCIVELFYFLSLTDIALNKTLYKLITYGKKNR